VFELLWLDSSCVLHLVGTPPPFPGPPKVLVLAKSIIRPPIKTTCRSNSDKDVVKPPMVALSWPWLSHPRLYFTSLVA
jgi:hypothetical protein